MSQIQKQKDFMGVFDMESPSKPTLDEGAAIFWSRLIDEEFAEMIEAWSSFLENPLHEENQANLTAEVVDVLYVIMGFAHSQGLPIKEMFDEVHNANMRKMQPDGSILRNEFGKVLKPVNWYPANKVAVIRRANIKAVTGETI